MIYTLLGIIALLVAGISLMKALEYSAFGELFGGIMVFCGGIGLIIYSVMAYSYVASEYQAKILNREYGTSYTRQDVFYASSVIDTIRELDRKRVEVNGDVITGK